MLKRVSAALLGTVLFAGVASAQETTIKFTLGWKTQGSDSAFFIARDKGYFKAEGLNVVIDQGEGSGATVTRVMSGAYDAGFGDVNAIIQNASTKPEEAPVMVFMITSYFNLVLNRQGPDKDCGWLSFGDYGLDLYSNGVMVSRKILASKPK